jgi:hypothetical protein
MSRSFLNSGTLIVKTVPIWIRIRLAILMPIQIRVWILDWHQNNANPNADPSPSLHILENWG